MVKKRIAPSASSICVGKKMSKRSFGKSSDVTKALKTARKVCKTKKYKVVKKKIRKRRK